MRLPAKCRCFSRSRHFDLAGSYPAKELVREARPKSSERQKRFETIMAANWTVNIFCFSFVLVAGIGVCSNLMPRLPMGPVVYNDRMSYMSTPFSNVIQDYEYLLMPTSTSQAANGCENCGPIKRKKRSATTSRKLPSDEALAVHGNPQAVLSPFPTLDPLREKTNKSQRNKPGKGNRNQKPNGLKENTPVMPGAEVHALNNGPEKRGRKKAQAKKGQAPPMREGQTPRRLRQHMQHKKKVKQFLQKRIQEQIEERSQNMDLKH